MFRRRLLGSTRGASGIEYGLLVGLLAVGIMAAVSNAGHGVSALFCAMTNTLSNATGLSGSCGASGGGSGSSGGAVNGQCLPALSPLASAPSGSTACAQGTVTASSLSGIGDPLPSGPVWTYTCSGSGGGSTATGCTAVSSLDTCKDLPPTAAGTAGAACNRLTRDGNGTDPVFVVSKNTLFAATSDVTNGTLWSTSTGGPNWTGMTSTPYAASYGFNEATSCDSGTCSTAVACNTLRPSANRGSFDQYDWYLPADTDLLATLNQLAGTVTTYPPPNGNKFFSSNTSGNPGYYWSASEGNNLYAWTRYYGGGWQRNDVSKYSHVLSVRCVRS